MQLKWDDLIHSAMGISMFSIHTAFPVAIFCLAASLNVFAQSQTQDPLWDRSTALQTVDRKQVMVALKPMYEMVRTGNEAGLLSVLSELKSDPDLPDPARDYVVYKFTLGLGDMEADAVSRAVIGWLSDYRSVTLVAHEDHPRHAVPLFNVRAAAQGVVNAWERQKAAIEAERKLGEAPDQFISAYLDASPAGRRGFIDALEFASTEQSAELSRLAVEHLALSPELTLMAARASIKSGEMQLLRRSIAQGEGPGLARALKEAAAGLSADETAGLLQYAMELESESKAALAIAQLAPGKLDDPAVRDLMFKALTHQTLGASAALVLGRSADPGIQFRLNEIAAGKEGLEKQRAKLAISFKPAGRVD